MTAQVATLTFATIALNFCIVLYVMIRIRVRLAVLVGGGIAALAMWTAVGPLITSRIDKQLGEAEYAARSYDWLPESVGFRLNVWITESIPAAMQRPITGWGPPHISGSEPTRRHRSSVGFRQNQNGCGQRFPLVSWSSLCNLPCLPSPFATSSGQQSCHQRVPWDPSSSSFLDSSSSALSIRISRIEECR
ncbi:hypothetical protein GS444_17560 [Rhodococcus hoagii]|nr:hypothetical protein [Prescottella equi]